MILAVIEPATEQVMAEVPRAGAEEVDVAVAAREGGVPGVAAPWHRPTGPRSFTGSRRRSSRESGGALAGWRRATPASPSGDARGEIGMVADSFRYYAGAPERLLGQTIPVAGWRRHDLPRAARRRRPHRAVELPAGDRFLEGRASSRRRQHDRPQAGRADAR